MSGTTKDRPAVRPAPPEQGPLTQAQRDAARVRQPVANSSSQSGSAQAAQREQQAVQPSRARMT